MVRLRKVNSFYVLGQVMSRYDRLDQLRSLYNIL
jgi:hypothetical protein